MQENDSSPLFLGKINNFEGPMDEHDCYTRAQVIPDTTPDVVTRPFSISWVCRGNLAKLKVGDQVVCGRFADGDGIIFFPADGSHTNIFPKDLVVEGDVTIKEGNLKVEGKVQADDDVSAGSISLQGHTHTGVHGGTSGPH